MLPQGHSEIAKHGTAESLTGGEKLVVDVLRELVPGEILVRVSQYLRMAACVTGSKGLPGENKHCFFLEKK